MREPGFYWVRFKHSMPEMPAYDPEIAFWGGSWMLSANSTDSPRDAELEVLSERLVPPGAPTDPVTCYVCDEPADLLDAYKRAALIGRALPVGGRVEVDGVYCKMLVRHPKQRAAKAAPKKAKSRPDRTRR